jgi:hypothetical protein
MKTLVTVGIALVVAAVAFGATRSPLNPAQMSSVQEQHTSAYPVNMPSTDVEDLTFVFTRGESSPSTP